MEGKEEEREAAEMSSPLLPEAGGAYIYDASTFLKGLRSISLRNLSFRCVHCCTTAHYCGTDDVLRRAASKFTSVRVFAFISMPMPHCISL